MEAVLNSDACGRQEMWVSIPTGSLKMARVVVRRDKKVMSTAVIARELDTEPVACNFCYPL